MPLCRAAEQRLRERLGAAVYHKRFVLRDHLNWTLTVLRPVFNRDIRLVPFVHREATTVKAIFKLVMATVTFLVFFYSTTIAMSLMYALDSALLSF
jgi:hypothetical protein